MTLTEAQRNAIRSDAEMYLYDDYIAIGNEAIDAHDVRAMMRLGLCVVDANVGEKDLASASFDLDILADHTHVRAMLAALAAELEKNR